MVLYLCETQVQKIRKALEKVGKDLKVTDMGDLKVIHTNIIEGQVLYFFFRTIRLDVVKMRTQPYIQHFILTVFFITKVYLSSSMILVCCA